MYEVTGFPNAPQSTYAKIPNSPLPGDVVRGNLWNDEARSVVVPRVTETGYVGTVTIANYNGGDTVGITVNGGIVAVIATTDAPTTAALLDAAINTAPFLSGVLTSTVVGAVLTLAGAVGVAVEVVEYSPDTTTSAVTGETAAVLQPMICLGMGVKKVPPSQGWGMSCDKPSALSDRLMGVVIRTNGSLNSPTMRLASGYNPDYLMPAQVYTALLGPVDTDVMVEFVGDAPTESDDVYWVCTGANAGKWRKDSGGTSEVVTLTLTTTTADTVGFSYDGLPSLSITSAGGVEIDDAAALYALWVGNASYAALGTIVDNLDGTLTITFADTTTHTFADASTGTSSIAEAVDTIAVAATAQLIPGYSWGAPSIPASVDLPARAVLRLTNA